MAAGGWQPGDQDPNPEHLRARSTGGRARRCAIFERRSDHLHMVLSEQCFSPFHICPRKITEETFKPCRMYGPEQDARLRSDVPEGMYCIFRDEHERSGRGTRDTVVELKVERSLDDVEKLVFGVVDV